VKDIHMKDLDAWVRKEIKAMEKMDAKIDKQLDKLEAIVGIKSKIRKPKSKIRKPRNKKERMAKACADRLIAQAIADGKITRID